MSKGEARETDTPDRQGSIGGDERLVRAREHIFAMDVNDAAAKLSIANMTYGVAKVHYAQEQYGYEADATFIGTPDMTITRNSGRWRAGMGYGGKMSWGDGDRNMLVLDVKPNTCGMLVGGLAARPDFREITELLHELHDTELKLDGIPISWDFGTGNHFVDVLEVVDDVDDRGLPQWVFVMHASGAELREGNEYGPGLYWDSSPQWQQRCDVVETPWGPLHILRDDALDEYVALHDHIDDFAKRRRVVAGQALFGDFETIANINHQGLANANEILLGCQSTDVPREQMLPIMVRADRPSFLMEGRPNLTDDVIESLGFAANAEKWGVRERLENADVIPHGAGYSLPRIREVGEVQTVNGTRYFELVRENETTVHVVSEPKDLACDYRDEIVVERTLQCQLGRIAARLEPVFVLKT